MSKKGWKLLTGLLVLSLLLVSYFVLKNKNQEETEEEEVYLLDIETENVTNLDIKNGDSKISFAKEEDNWTVSGEDGFLQIPVDWCVHSRISGAPILK